MILRAHLRRRIMRFRNDRRGTVATISAIAIPVLIGVAGLGAEIGHGLLSRAQNQRVADMAAYAGALAYNSSASTTTMSNAAKSVAALNGIPASAVTATLIASPRDASSQAVFVKIATNNIVLLAPVLNATGTLAIEAKSYAQLGAQTDACIIALSAGGSGVTLSGGTSISATGCAVASNNTVTVPCGTTLNAKIVAYNSAAAPSQPCSGIAATSIVKTSTNDPLAGNSGVTTATGRVTTVAALTSPAAPAAPSVTSTRDLAFDWSNVASGSTTMANATAVGCTVTFTNPTFTLTCPSGGTYNFQNLYLGGGISVNFNTAGSAATTYNFSGCVANTGASLAFGPGTYNIVKGIATGGGTTTTFGAGTFNVGASTMACNSISSYPSTCNGYSLCNTGSTLTLAGPSTFSFAGGILTTGGSSLLLGAGASNTFTVGSGTAACNGGGIYSLCNLSSSTTTLGGPSPFSFSNGIYNNGGSTLVLGSGATNTFRVGKSSDGNALYGGGGSKTTFADATSGTTSFQLNGNFNMAAGGGSCMTISAAAQHDINGYFATAGGTILGAGVYTINGYIGLGINGGGDVTCNGVTVGMNGTGVTLVTSGATAIGSGSCSGLSFCIAAGYGNVSLTAPTSGMTAKLVVIGPSANAYGATLAEGASNTSVSGAFYFPLGPISLNGGASIGNGSGQCLQLIGTQVSLSGGTTAASACVSSAGASSSSVSLVQ